MKNNKLFETIGTVCTLLAIGAGLYVQISRRGDASSGKEPDSSVIRVGGIKDEGAVAKPVVSPKRKAKTTVKVAGGEKREKPRLLDFEDEEEKELTELARKVLTLLQDALDAENIEQIRAILAMAKKEAGGSLSKKNADIPVAMKKRIVEALGWFGNTAIPDLMEFLADEEPEIVHMTADQFDLALQDISLGDRERGEIITLAGSVLSDRDVLEMMFMEIANMRNSVAAQTIVDICHKGTDVAKELIVETMEFVTGEEDIETVEDMERWLGENPDGPDDEDLYGPMPVDVD